MTKEQITASGYKMHFLADKLGITYMRMWRCANGRTKFTKLERERLSEIMKGKR